MTNLQTIAGGLAWMFTALVLIAATLEPVSVEQPGFELASAETRVAAACLDGVGAIGSCPVYVA